MASMNQVSKYDITKCGYCHECGAVWLAVDNETGIVSCENDHKWRHPDLIKATAPKRYPFAESYHMMKAGRWMYREHHPECAFRWVNGQWYRRRHSKMLGWKTTEELVNDYERNDYMLFSSKDIDGLWEEAQP